jgi:hypothetical protein
MAIIAKHAIVGRTAKICYVCGKKVALLEMAYGGWNFSLIYCITNYMKSDPNRLSTGF